MSTGKKKQKQARAPQSVNPVQPVSHARESVPWFALCSAALLAFACVMPLVLWGNPYPAGVGTYWLVAGLIIAACALAIAALPFEFVRNLSLNSYRALRKPKPLVFALCVAALTTLLSAGFALYAFETFPSTSDEVAQLWHARMLAQGHLSLPADPNPEFFAVDNVVDTGRWYSQYPIGAPMVLAVGVLLGVPWLINPLLAGVSAAMLYHFSRRAFGESQGRAIALLFSVTPIVLMMSGSYMNHVPVLCLAMCTLAALIEWTYAVTPRRRWIFAALIGLSVGAAATIRPLDAMVVALVVGLLQLVIVIRDRSRAREWSVQTLAALIALAPMLYANRATTGNALRFGYEVMWGATHQIGFHLDPNGEMHTLRRAFEYALTYVSGLNVFLVAWPVPALLIATIALLTMRKFTQWDSVILDLFWVQVIAYACYWFQGDFLGPRFLFTALPTIVVFLARAPFLVGDRFGAYWQRVALIFTFACIVLTWCSPALPFGVWALSGRLHRARPALRTDIAGAVADAHLKDAVVFLREPFGSRLLRRMWGAGLSREVAAKMLASRDACSLLAELRLIENSPAMARDAKTTAIQRAAPHDPSAGAFDYSTDPTVHISSPASLTPECRAEIDADVSIAGAIFGPALLLEPIDKLGRIDGSVIYAVDLGERNNQLRNRFGSRRWYRMSTERTPQGKMRPVIKDY